MGPNVENFRANINTNSQNQNSACTLSGNVNGTPSQLNLNSNECPGLINSGQNLESVFGNSIQERNANVAAQNREILQNIDPNNLPEYKGDVVPIHSGRHEGQEFRPLGENRYQVINYDNLPEKELKQGHRPGTVEEYVTPEGYSFNSANMPQRDVPGARLDVVGEMDEQAQNRWMGVPLEAPEGHKNPFNQEDLQKLPGRIKNGFNNFFQNLGERMNTSI